MPARPFNYVHGAIHLPELALWLDAHEARAAGERVFVSHAHSDHTAAHRETILSKGTARLMQARLGGKRVEHVLPFREPHRFEGPGEPFQITLLPAGHILGSAMSFIEWQSGSLLYTGDFKLRQGFASETCDASAARACDMLVMETTFGRPHYQFPPAADVMRDIVRFCEQALDGGATAVLLGYSLGRCQELLRGLAGTGLPLVVHDAAHKLTKVFTELGWEFPLHESMDRADLSGKVVLCPPNATKPVLARIAGAVRMAVITGWAVDNSCRFRHRADAAFALSDHADFPELIEFVRQIEPKKIFTVHGFAADFAQTLRELGFDAHALSENDQLQFPFWSSAPAWAQPGAG
jgi:Cft2 family RNA processing exonuclease